MRRFLRRQEGGATVELVLILPVFLLIVALIVDASLVLFRQSQAYRVIQDANRSLSIGRLTTPQDTSAAVAAALASIAPGTTAVSQVAGGIVTTTVSMPVSELQVTGLLTAFQGGTISVRASHIIEQ